MSLKVSFIGIFFVCFLACGGGTSLDTSTTPAPSVLQGARVLGLDVKEVPAVTYGMAYDQAITLGVREVSVSLDWELLEPTLGNYDDTIPAIIESFYPQQAADLTLVLRPLDTPGARLPAELVGLAFDDPAVITAFENFLTHLHNTFPTLNASGKLKWIHVGNEIDANLGLDATKWSQWQTFFVAAKTKIKALWGSSVEVSSIIQFSALTNTPIKDLYVNLLAELDSAVLTYYPLNSDFSVRSVSSIEADFDLMANSIIGKSILLQECGYPSSTVNNSSEASQADFISAVFSAWDKYSDRINLIDFSWQYDVDEATADQWVIDFGLSGQPNENAFKYYLWTLGLSNYDASEKLALQRLRDELQNRGWVK